MRPFPFFIALGAALVFACTRPAVSPAPDASDGAAPVLLDSSGMACAHLKQLGCPLGDDPNCEAVFALPSKFRVDSSCVLEASSLAGLAACNVTCQP